MEKYCPNCGKKNKLESQYCSNCGYDFTQRNDHKANFEGRPRRREFQSKPKHNTAIMILLVLVLACIVMGVLLYSQQNENLSTGSSSSSKSNQTTTQSMSSNGEKSQKLTNNNDPNVDASAIIWYSISHGYVDKDQDSIDNGYIVRMDKSDDFLSCLSKQGQGVAYEVYINSRSNDGSPNLVYTIDQDNMINIYRFADNFDTDEVYEPIKIVSKQSIYNYLNTNDQYQQVTDMSKKISLESTNS